MTDFLFFDIETRADESRLALVDDLKPPKTVKDVAAWKAKKLQSAALDPDLARVSSVSWSIGATGAISTLVALPTEAPLEILAGRDGFAPDHPVTLITGEVAEKELLYRFWAEFNQCDGYACGWHIIGFDFPFLMRRSLYEKVGLLVRPKLAKYHTEPVRDLFAILNNWTPGKGLKEQCALFGIPTMGATGVDVQGMSWQDEARYGADDVRLCQEMYKRMSAIYFSGDKY